MNKLPLLGLGLLLWVACKTPKNNLSQGPTPEAQSTTFLMEQLKKRRVEFQSFSAKAKVDVEMEKEQVRFTSTIRMLRDSLIWINFKKVSIEGARVRISPQQIEILNHQDNEYLVKPFSYLKDELNIPLNFSELQDLLIGNPIMLEQFDLQSGVAPGCYRLETTKNSKDYLGLWLHAKTLQLLKVEADFARNNLVANFNNYKPIEGQELAWSKKIVVETEKGERSQVEIDFQQISLNEELRFPFEVPEHYKQIN